MASVLALIGLSTSLLGPKFDWYSFGPYDSKITRPEVTLEYGPGQRHTTFRDQERVHERLLQDAKGRIKRIEIGRTWENRPLRILIIGSPENMARIDAIQANLAKLATGEPGHESLIKNLAAIVWVNETVHGNESASFESGMWLAYTLTASRNPKIESILKNTVVIINPVMNPDGHERFTVWNQSIATKTLSDYGYEKSEPDWVHGRTNHYRFDMNRDRVAFSQRESIAEAAALRQWNPQVYIDQHGQTSEYFFPPNSMSVNTNFDRNRIEKWTQVFGRANASAFDAIGWLYFVRDTFDFYYIGYLDTYSTFLGAIGMTYETDGGRQFRSLKNDGTELTLESGMAKHFTTAIATISAASAERENLLNSFYAFKKSGASGAHSKTVKRIVVTHPDRRALNRLHVQLGHAGILSGFATESFSQPGATAYGTNSSATITVPAGSLIVEMAQPLGQMAKAMLEPGQDFEQEFIEAQLKAAERETGGKPTFDFEDSTGFYDITGWSVVFGHNLTAYTCTHAPKINVATSPAKIKRVVPAESNVGYVLHYTDVKDAVCAYRLAEQGIRVRTVRKDLKVGDITVPKGSFVCLVGRNEDGLRDAIWKVAMETETHVTPLPSGYPESTVGVIGLDTRPIRKPKVGVIFGNDETTTSFGHPWYVFEQALGIQVDGLQTSAMDAPLNNYSCIVFPAGRYSAPSAALKAWIQNGGCAVILGGSWAIGEGRLLDLKPVKLKEDKAIRSIPGAIFQADLDDRSILSFGYGLGDKNNKIPLAIQVDGSRLYTAPDGINPVVQFSNSDKKLLSGWSWPNNSEEALKGAVAVAETTMGAGRIVYFAWDPTERAMWPGQYKLFLNAVLLGPQDRF